ncbi:aldo-keto reductase family 1 member C8 isoform X2 [Homo sapiens]|uniref:aldo-keto reductase family 1 member C8 isoform X2 n=1 Tax=Homo sapiens TaxID=9606 RepID=UPI001FB0C24D|nr:putative aldo-keto reductase family 1 member C8 isoform X2 [Homo sapiens]
MTPKSQAAEATKVAIDVGFRHIDSAYLYQNEEEVGQAIWEKIADGTVKREEIFYTIKLWATFFRAELVHPALERSLKKLGPDYVDLFIIHVPFAMKVSFCFSLLCPRLFHHGYKHLNYLILAWFPGFFLREADLSEVHRIAKTFPGKELLPKDASGEIILETVELCDTWEALEKCKEAGLTRSIGVSNFNHKLLELILNKPGLKYKPTCNQVECHPYLNQSKLLEFCKSKDIVLVAYSALGSQRDPQWVDPDCPHLLEEPILKSIAKKHSGSPGQVALRYQLQRGVVVLAKSFSQERIKENFQIFDFELTPEDMKAIDGLNRNLRYDKLQLLWYQDDAGLCLLHQSRWELQMGAVHIQPSWNGLPVRE